jgi:glyoxylase-like metal-dependent hydrolase (beta-lactamase superfamily II)
VQVLGVHSDVVVARSAMWQTTATIVRRGDESFLIDSPVFQDELDALPRVLQQTGWALSGLLATHGDWDHLLARIVFPDATLGVAETTAARLRGEPGDAQRSLRDFDEEHYVSRPRPLSLGNVQALPVPGHLEIGDAELEVLPADGHTHDGMAIWVPWAKVLIPGDYLLPVEIPWLQEQGSRDAYLATLERLRPYVEQADWIVGGHGGPVEQTRALELLDEDTAYLRALPDEDVSLPAGRDTRRQRRIHEENVKRVRATA